MQNQEKIQCNQFDTVVILKAKGWFKTVGLKTLFSAISDTEERYYYRDIQAAMILRSAGKVLSKQALARIIEFSLENAFSQKKHDFEGEGIIEKINTELATMDVAHIQWDELPEEIAKLK